MTDIPHPIDGHVSFSAEWDGFPRTILILDEAVEQAAGRPLDRDAAAAYVHQHIDRFLAAAKRVAAASPIPAARVVTIDELGPSDWQAMTADRFTVTPALSRGPASVLGRKRDPGRARGDGRTIGCPASA